MANIREAAALSTTVATPVVTTTETVAIASPSFEPPSDAFQAVIIAWAQLTTGTNTTAVTPRVRRGNAITGTLLGAANAEQVKAAAGSTEAFFMLTSEDRTSCDFIQYCFTLQQTAASANGSILQASILVMVI